MCDRYGGGGLQIKDLCKLKLQHNHDVQTDGVISEGTCCGRRCGSPRSQESLHGDKQFLDQLHPYQGRSGLSQEFLTGGAVANVSKKVQRRILLLCSWQPWVLLCSILASTADILDLYPRNISDQNMHYKPGQSKAGRRVVQDYRRSRDGKTNYGIIDSAQNEVTDSLKGPPELLAKSYVVGDRGNTCSGTMTSNYCGSDGCVLVFKRGIRQIKHNDMLL